MISKLSKKSNLKNLKRKSIKRKSNKRKSMKRKSMKRKSMKRKSIKRKSIKRKSIKRKSIKRKSIKRKSMKRNKQNGGDKKKKMNNLEILLEKLILYEERIMYFEDLSKSNNSYLFDVSFKNLHNSIVIIKSISVENFKNLKETLKNNYDLYNNLKSDPEENFIVGLNQIKKYFKERKLSLLDSIKEIILSDFTDEEAKEEKTETKSFFINLHKKTEENFIPFLATQNKTIRENIINIIKDLMKIDVIVIDNRIYGKLENPAKLKSDLKKILGSNPILILYESFTSDLDYLRYEEDELKRKLEKKFKNNANDEIKVLIEKICEGYNHNIYIVKAFIKLVFLFLNINNFSDFTTNTKKLQYHIRNPNQKLDLTEVFKETLFDETNEKLRDYNTKKESLSLTLNKDDKIKLNNLLECHRILFNLNEDMKLKTIDKTLTDEEIQSLGLSLIIKRIETFFVSIESIKDTSSYKIIFEKSINAMIEFLNKEFEHEKIPDSVIDHFSGYNW